MKKTLRMKIMLLLCALIAGSGSAWATDYVKVTSASDLVEGEVYVIAEISTNTRYLVTGYGTKLQNTTSGFTVSDNTITTTTATPLEFTLGTVTSGNNTYYTLQFDNNGTVYLGYNSSTNFRTATDATNTKEQWSITSNNSYDIRNVSTLNVNTKRRIARNNTSIGPYDASSSYTPCYLFKKQSSSGDDPTISAEPTTLNAFTYVEGSGPSAAQTISVSGSNLTDPIVLTLGTESNYEISTSQNSGYNYTVNLNPDNGTVSATNVYVRLKSGLEKGTHNGTLTISTDGADDINVSLSGSVTGQAHAVTVATGLTGGTIEADPTSAVEGATISLTANPEDAYTFGSWSVYKTGDQSTTVSVSNNQFTMPDYAVTVTASFNAKPTHTATFSVNGNTNTSTFYEGQTITFPANPAAIGGKSFVGWSETSISGTTNMAPTLVTSATMGNSNVTYYAVFADVTGTTAASWTETALGSLTSSDIFVIVGNNGDTYALSSANGTSSAPPAYAVTIANGEINTDATPVTDALKFNISGDATNGYTFYPNGSTTTYIYCTDTNNGVRVGKPNANTTEIHAFTVTDGYLKAGFSTARYLGIYNSSDWRCYTSKTNNSNIAGQTFAYYKYTAGSATYGNYCTSVVLSYSVTYDGNGATSGDVPTDATAYSPNASVTVLGNTGNLAKTGYTFGGWNTQTNGQGTNYTANATFNITENTTLYAKWTAKTCTNLTATGTLTQTTYSAGDSFNPEGLTVTATYNDASQEDVTASVTWTPNPLTQGTTSVTGTYMGQTVNVNGLTVTAAAGSADNPYTVAQAIYAINNSGTVNGVYVKGIISQIDSYNSTYNSLTYWISDDGTTTSQFEVYSGLGINGTAFSSTSDLAVGDEVVVTGDIKKYNSVYEFNYNNQLVSLKLVAPTFSVAAGAVASGTTVTISNLHSDATIRYTIDGTDPTNESTEYSTPITITTATTIKAIAVKEGYTTSDVAEAAYTLNTTPTISVDPASLTGFTYVVDNGPSTTKTVSVSGANLTANIALSLGNNSNYEMCLTSDGTYTNSLSLSPTTGTVDATTVYVRLKSGLVVGDSYSGTISLTSTGASDASVSLSGSVTEPVVDYATLPFTWDNTTTPTGITTDNTGGFYAGSPYIKLNQTGTGVVILKLNAAPGIIAFDIKGNPSSGTTSTGTFTVATSADGTDYTTLATYSSIVNKKQTMYFINLNDDTRYIKWSYAKESGNVALGNFNIRTEAEQTTTWTEGEFTPVSNQIYVVNDGATLILDGDYRETLTNASNLIIEDGGQLITHYAVAATVKKEIEKTEFHSTKDGEAPEGWYSISSSVNPTTILTNTNLVTESAFDLYYYKETVGTMQWVNYHQPNSQIGFTTMDRGRGYLYRNEYDVTIEFTGTVNTDNITYNVTKSAVGTLSGFNLIGNPFTHDISKGSGENIDDDKLNTGFYVATNSGAWEPCSDGTIIEKNQGFLVQANTAGDITIKNTVTSKGGDKANHDNIKFMVSNTQYEDVTYAMFDKGRGLNKISHRNAEIPMLYIPQNDENYAIAMMDDNTQAFNLSFKAMTMGKYTLSYKAKGEFNYLHIIDRMTGEDVDMLLESEYSFVGTPSDNENRFIVRLGYKPNYNDNGEDIFAYQNGNDIVVSGEGELQVFDVMGRMISTRMINGVETVNIQTQGVYIMKLNEKTQKIVVR